jgi:hypothetical protein
MASAISSTPENTLPAEAKGPSRFRMTPSYRRGTPTSSIAKDASLSVMKAA